MTLQSRTIPENGCEGIAELHERVEYLSFVNKHLEERLQGLEARNKDLDRQNLDLKFAKDQLTRRLQEATPVPRNTNSADIAGLKAQLEAKDSVIAEARKDQDGIMKQLFLVGDVYMEAILSVDKQSAIKEGIIDKVTKSLPSLVAQEWMGHWEAARRRHEKDPTVDDYATKSQSTTGFCETIEEEQRKSSLRRDHDSVFNSDDEATGPSQPLGSTKKLKPNPEGSWMPGLGEQADNLGEKAQSKTLRSGLEHIVAVQKQGVEESSRSSTPSSISTSMHVSTISALPAASAGSGQKTAQQAQDQPQNQTGELLSRPTSWAATSEPDYRSDMAKSSKQNMFELKPRAAMAPNGHVFGMRAIRDKNTDKIIKLVKADVTPPPKTTSLKSDTYQRYTSRQGERGDAKGRDTSLDGRFDVLRNISYSGEQMDRPDAGPVFDVKPKATPAEAICRMTSDRPTTPSLSQEGKGNLRDQTLPAVKTAAPPSENPFMRRPQSPPRQWLRNELIWGKGKKNRTPPTKAASISASGGAKTQTAAPPGGKVGEVQEPQTPPDQQEVHAYD